MKNVIRLAALAFVLLSPAAARAQQGLCSAIATSSLQKDGGAFANSYSATSILDIDVAALFSNATASQMKGEHVAEIRVYTPKGHLYQSISIPFSVDEKLRGKKKSISGYPRPIPVTVLNPVKFDKRTYYAVSGRLPVAGTAIIANSLYGTWRAETFLDGAGLSCGGSAAFEITQ